MKLAVLKCSWTDCKSTRTVAVPGSLTLDRLHKVLQDAFGWEEDHLFGFHDSKGRRWKSDFADDIFDDETDASETTVDEVFADPEKINEALRARFAPKRKARTKKA